MPSRPTERINFVIEKWPRYLKVRAFLYDAERLIATTSRTVPVSAEAAEWVRVAEAMDAVDYLVARADAMRSQPPLPW